MYPAYRYMDSYPHGPHPYSRPLEHMPSPYYQYPSWEAFPPHMRIDTPKHPSAWGPGHFHGNVSHQSPIEGSSGCCVHSYPHGPMNFRPPYPQPQPLPQSYYGPYVSHEPYPYFVPPAPYLAGQARYDYDKHGSQCCGCPNHSHRMDHGGVRVEEHNPEVVEPEKSASSIIRLPGNASPIVWVPSDNLKGKEENKKPEQQSAVWFPNHSPQIMWIPSSLVGKEENKNSESLPAHSNGWVPLDIRSLKDLMRYANEKKDSTAEENKNKLDTGSIKDLVKIANEKSTSSADDSKHKLDIGNLMDLIRAAAEKTDSSSNENKNDFSWPLIWVPSNYKAEGMKDVNGSVSPKTAEEVLPKFKIIPMKLIDDRGEKPEIDQQKSQESREKTKEKESNPKTVPVRQMEENTKDSSTPEEHREKDSVQKVTTPESNEGEAGGKKISEGIQNGQSKTSKLPPVCLRLDPIPKNKNGSGKSRSPSPPSPSTQQKSSAKENKDEAGCAKEIRVVDVNNKPEDNAQKHIKESQGVPLDSHIKADNQMDDKTLEIEKEGTDNELIKKIKESETKENQNVNVESKVSDKRSRILSPIDAALRIQSAYRGYEVRRWRPLEKLRKIADIHKQANSISKQLQALDETPSIPDKKQIVAMNENIMHLLLQLDTIQGLHQSVREARKSVARELISLQEKLDAISRQASKEPQKVEATISDGTSTSDLTTSSTVVINDKETTIERGPHNEIKAQKTQTANSDGTSTSGFTSSSTVVDSEKEALIEQGQDSFKEKNAMDSAVVGNEASKGPGGMTDKEGNDASKRPAGMTDEVSVLEDVVLHGAKEVVEAQTGTYEVASSLNHDKGSGSPEINDAPSTPANSSDSDVSRTEEFNLKDSSPVNQEPIVVKKEFDPDGSGTPEEDAIKEPAYDKDESTRISQLVVNQEPIVVKKELDPDGSRTPEQDVIKEPAYDRDESTRISELVAQVQEPEELQENQGPNLQLCEAKDEHSVVGGEILEPTSLDDTAHSALPIVKQEDGGSEVANLSEVKSSEPLSIVAEPTADVEVASSIVEKPVLIEFSMVQPNDEFSNEEYLQKEETGDGGNTIKEEIISVADASAVLDGQVQVQTTEVPVEAAYSDAERIDTAHHKVEGAEVDMGAARTKRHNNEAMDDTSVMLKEEPAVQLDQVVNAKGSMSEDKDEDVAKLAVANLTTGLSKEELKNKESTEQNDLRRKEEMKLVEENEKLREMLERLLAAGQDQLRVIGDLNGRIKDLEKKLSQKRRLRSKRQKVGRPAERKIVS